MLFQVFLVWFIFALFFVSVSFTAVSYTENEPLNLKTARIKLL